MKRIATLDGVRGVAILLVLLAHLGGTRGFASFRVTHAIGDIGNLGVRIFFILSGFLITTLLLEEHRANDRICLTRFYVRRFFRIFPAAYTFIAVIAVLDAYGYIALKSNDVLSATLYVANYHRDHSWYVGHLWSLSVEEQFYLLWPVVIVAAGFPRSIRIAAVFVLIAPVLRVYIWYKFPAQRPGIGLTFETVADTLATGCALAGIRDRMSTSVRYATFVASRWSAALPLAILAMTTLNSYTRIGRPLGETLLNVSIALWIDRAVRLPGTPSSRFLSCRLIASIGAVSYSLYLWQQLFINRDSSSISPAFPWNIILSATAAMISYALIERPVLRMRAWLESRFTTGRRQAERFSDELCFTGSPMVLHAVRKRPVNSDARPFSVSHAIEPEETR